MKDSDIGISWEAIKKVMEVHSTSFFNACVLYRNIEAYNLEEKPRVFFNYDTQRFEPIEKNNYSYKFLNRGQGE